MTTSHPVHTVCPHCKRPVVALREQPRAHCAEHGVVVPMRSAIVNPPLKPAPPAEAA
ncbi:MAG: hypothetical protein KDJ22_04880 [Candidatus Competibacteraceae bacterium]|nr:hypothetical protein [Candidatus Competibacteraceae bacterium]MCP5126985.1 hypothetical protein [Gammaproteobacteria bacterium]HRX70489.1 hypothetical protein [Candidatus Competibacteraceae bacterium]